MKLLGTTQDLSFAPSSIATSSRIRPGGRADLLIRDAHANRFFFLVNLDNGSFRPAIGPNNGFFNGAGDFDDLLVGNVAHNDANPPDDVITYDRDMTLKIFVNSGLESFIPSTVAFGGNPSLAGAVPPYLLSDFGSGTLSLAAPVSRGGQISLIMLQGDGTGGFTPGTGVIPLEAIRGTATTTLKTTFLQTSGTPAGSSSGNIDVLQTAAAHSAATCTATASPTSRSSRARPRLPGPSETAPGTIRRCRSQ